MDNPNSNTLILGNSLTLTHNFIGSNSAAYDPADVKLTIVRNVTLQVAGPFTYAAHNIIKISTGHYSFTYTPPATITPGTYSAKWEGTVQGNPTVTYFNFQILDPPIELSTILDPPRTVGIMRPSPLFQRMGLGQTDRLFLVGHASGPNLNDPYQVVNMQETINVLGGDNTSPMIRSLLEAYNGGSRDIWLVAAAPITEYVPFDPNDEENRFIGRPEWGGLNFYQRYAERLTTTYSYLREWDLPEIICPIEAPFYDTRGVDFLTPLIKHCADAFAETGTARIGIVGTRIVNRTSTDITTMINDSRLDALVDAGKFAIIVVGEGTFALPQMPVAHLGSLGPSAAAALATNLPHQGLTYRLLPNVISVVGQDFTKQQVKDLANVRLNPAIRTEKGKRGIPYQVVLACDNTLSQDGSDFWSISIMRLVTKVINHVKALGNRYIGTVAYTQFREDTKKYLASLAAIGYIRGYDLNIVKDRTDNTKILVNISLRPFTTIREVFFSIEVGSGG